MAWESSSAPLSLGGGGPCTDVTGELRSVPSAASLVALEDGSEDSVPVAVMLGGATDCAVDAVDGDAAGVVESAWEPRQASMARPATTSRARSFLSNPTTSTRDTGGLRLGQLLLQPLR